MRLVKLIILLAICATAGNPASFGKINPRQKLAMHPDLAGHSEANDAPISLVTFQIPGLINSADEGPFIELLKEIERRSGVSFKVELLPSKRANTKFFDGKYDVMFPSGTGKLPQKELFCLTGNIYTKRDFLFYLKGNSQIREKLLTEQINVGVVSGYSYPVQLLKNTRARLEATTDMVSNMRKLLKGRLDAVISEEIEGMGAIHEIGAAQQIVYDPTDPISLQDTHFVFHKRPDLNSLCDKIRKVSAELGKEKWLDGRIGKLMEAP